MRVTQHTMINTIHWAVCVDLCYIMQIPLKGEQEKDTDFGSSMDTTINHKAQSLQKREHKACSLAHTCVLPAY